MGRLPSLSLTARLALLFSLGFSAVLVGLGALVADTIQRHFRELDVDVLSGKIVLVQEVLDHSFVTGDSGQFARRLSEAMTGHANLSFQVLTSDGMVLQGSGSAVFPPEWARSVNKGKLEIFEWQANDRAYRRVASEIESPTGPPYRIAVALDIGHHLVFMNKFQRSLWRFIALAALTTAAIGWLAASRGLRPLRMLRDRLSSVTAKRLHQRLDVADVPEEVAGLVASLNEMLERLDDAFRRLSDFSSDLAHELRTPINSLMMQTQVALSRERGAGAYRATLEENAEELERLARMISDMLFLAKADHGLALVRQEQVDLKHELRELFDFYGALAEEKGVRLLLEGRGMLYGDRLMLRRALSNLLSNALRHTAPGMDVTVRVRDSNQTVSVCVENPGEAISEKELSRLFERFYRGEPSRSHARGEGTGLGLAIVKSIVTAHGGKISASSSAGENRFTLQFPLRRRLDQQQGQPT